MTRDEAREHLRKIERAASGNPGYTEVLSDLEIESWLAFFQAIGLINEAA